MDEYKQLKDNLNRAPNQRQHEQNAPQQVQVAAIAPESHIHRALQPTLPEQPHKEEPGPEENHLKDRQDRVI